MAALWNNSPILSVRCRTFPGLEQIIEINGDALPIGANGFSKKIIGVDRSSTLS
jgi:hypothetical protein